MANIIDFVKNSMEKKCEICFKFDEEKEMLQLDIEGNKTNILTGISYIVDQLIENGMPKELIWGAVRIGTGEEKSHKQSNIMNGMSSKKKAEILEKVLEKIVKGDV